MNDQNEEDFLKELENGGTPKQNESHVGEDGAHTEAPENKEPETRKSETPGAEDPEVKVVPSTPVRKGPEVTVAPAPEIKEAEIKEALKPTEEDLVRAAEVAAGKSDGSKLSKPDAPKPVVKEEKKSPYSKEVVESRKALEQPLPPGHKFFEAPDGYVKVAESSKSHLWYRKGKCYMNPVRSSRKR